MLRRTDACKISRKDSAATQLSHVSGLTSQSSEGSGVNVWDCSYLTSAATYSSVTRTPVRSEPKFPAKATRLQGGEFDASLRGLAKNQSGASVSEMLSYGSFADVIGKIEEQKSKDFPATALNVLSLFSEGEASGAAGPSGALQPTSEARELKDKLLNMAKAKTAKLFELLTPPQHEQFRVHCQDLHPDRYRKGRVEEEHDGRDLREPENVDREQDKDLCNFRSES